MEKIKKEMRIVYKGKSKKSPAFTPYMVYTLIMSGKDFVKKLIKDGWELDRVNGSHHILRKNGIAISVPIHKNEDLDKGIYNQLNKKAGYKK